MGLPWAHTASGRWETEPCLLRGVPAPSTGQWTCTASPGSCEKERDHDREHKREKRKMSGHHTITSSTKQFSSFEPFCSHTGHYHDPAFRRKHKTSFFIYVAFLLHKIRVVETAMCNVMFCIYKESRPFIKSSLNSVKTKHDPRNALQFYRFFPTGEQPKLIGSLVYHLPRAFLIYCL